MNSSSMSRANRGAVTQLAVHGESRYAGWYWDALFRAGCYFDEAIRLYSRNYERSGLAFWPLTSLEPWQRRDPSDGPFCFICSGSVVTQTPVGWASEWPDVIEDYVASEATANRVETLRDTVARIEHLDLATSAELRSHARKALESLEQRRQEDIDAWAHHLTQDVADAKD